VLIIAQCAAYFLNALDERVLGHDDLRPKHADQIVFGRDATAMLDEILEGSEGFRSQAHLLAVAHETRAVRVERELVENVKASAFFHLTPAGGALFSAALRLLVGGGGPIIGQPSSFGVLSPACRRFLRTCRAPRSYKLSRRNVRALWRHQQITEERHYVST
jgi:hypothetical protein